MAYFRSNVSGGIPAGVKNLPTVDTASGSVASFDTDMTENLVEVKCQIVAQQASGTPSPSNPRPITTFSEMNVTSCGKNLFNKNDITLLDVDDVPTARYGIKINKAGTYNINSFFSGNAYIYANSYINGVWTTGIYIQRGSPSTITPKTITINDNDFFIIYDASGSDDLITAKEKLEYVELEIDGSATTYVPYNGTTANIPFGQTVANGVLDITTGKLRVTHFKTDIIGNVASAVKEANLWRITANNAFYDVNFRYQMGLCNALLFKTDYAQVNDNNNTVAFNNNAGLQLIFRNDSITTEAEALTFVETLEFVYPLATPIEIQLSATQITALLNENNIWCDTGDTSVKYILSVGKKIS